MSEQGLSLGVPPAFVDELARAVAAKVLAQLPDPAAAPASATDGALALQKRDAAKRIGVSVDFFEQHVMPEIRIVREGRLRLVPVSELERWLDRHAARTLDG